MTAQDKPCRAPACDRLTLWGCCIDHWMALPPSLRRKIRRLQDDLGRDHPNVDVQWDKAERIWHEPAVPIIHDPCQGVAFYYDNPRSGEEITSERVHLRDGSQPIAGTESVCGSCGWPAHFSDLSW